MNGSSMRWLAGGERSAVAYLGDGETWRKRKKEASAAGSFIAGGERELAAGPHVIEWRVVGRARVPCPGVVDSSPWAGRNPLNQHFSFIQTYLDLQNTNPSLSLLQKYSNFAWG
jgi:hypothetical protein